MLLELNKIGRAFFIARKLNETKKYLEEPQAMRYFLIDMKWWRMRVAQSGNI